MSPTRLDRLGPLPSRDPPVNVRRQNQAPRAARNFWAGGAPSGRPREAVPFQQRPTQPPASPPYNALFVHPAARLKFLLSRAVNLTQTRSLITVCLICRVPQNTLIRLGSISEGTQGTLSNRAGIRKKFLLVLFYKELGSDYLQALLQDYLQSERDRLVTERIEPLLHVCQYPN